MAEMSELVLDELEANPGLIASATPTGWIGSARDLGRSGDPRNLSGGDILLAETGCHCAARRLREGAGAKPCRPPGLVLLGFRTCQSFYRKR